jgi:hypothetical protein
MADPEIIRQLEEDGPEIVRARLNDLMHPVYEVAKAWLAQKDREASERADASMAEQMALAREANSLARAASEAAERSANAARTSNKIAIAALIVAIMAAIATIIGHH